MWLSWQIAESFPKASAWRLLDLISLLSLENRESWERARLGFGITSCALRVGVYWVERAHKFAELFTF